MDETLDIRLKADRELVAYLCRATGKTASALAAGAEMAPTTLNRFTGRKTRLKSTLKELTIRKIAKRWGFDYLELIAYRQKIEEALRDGKPAPDFDKGKGRGGAGGMKEPPGRAFSAPERDPLLDQIMGATYDVWFNTAAVKQAVAFDTLPGLVRLLYTRIRNEAKPPTPADIKKRAADMLAAMALDGGKKSR